MTSTSVGVVAAGSGATTSRFAGLEGLRTIGVVSVFASHIGFATGTTFGSTWRVGIGSQGFRPAVLLGHLEFAVAIFFMISAFLLYRPFAAAMYSGRALPKSADFLRRRLVRAFPAYWVALGLLFAIHSVSARSFGHALRMITLTQIYSKRDFFANRTLVPSWTLATEFTFYFMLVGYVSVMSRLRFPNAKRRLQCELLTLAGLCVLAVGWRAMVYHVHAMPEVAEFWLPGTMDVFALGLGLAAIDGYQRSGERIDGWNRFARHGDLWAAVAVLLYLAVPVLTNASEGIGVTHGWSAYGRNFFQMLCAFCLLLPVVFGDQSVGLYRRIVRMRPLAYIGSVSYGIYLWHDHWIVQAIHWSGGIEALRGHFWLVGITAFSLSFACGVASFALIEQPALGLDTRYSTARKKRAS